MPIDPKLLWNGGFLVSLGYDPQKAKKVPEVCFVSIGLSYRDDSKANGRFQTLLRESVKFSEFEKLFWSCNLCILVTPLHNLCCEIDKIDLNLVDGQSTSRKGKIPKT